MFHTGIGWVNFIKLSWQLFAYCLSINSPIALESMRAVMDLFSAVSVVLISTFNFSDFGVSSIAAIINFSSRTFSHFSFCILGINGVRVEIGVRFSSVFCTSEEGILESDIFANTSKQLQVDDEGMLFTCCLVQNPPLLESCALISLIKFPSEVYPSYPSTPFLTLQLLTTLYQTSGGSLELYVQVDCIYNRSAELGSFLANVNVHRHWVTQNQVNVSSWRDFEKALLNGTEGGGHRMGGSGHRSSVGQFEGFICHTVLVYTFSCFVPVFQGSIRQTSVGHHSNGVLDLGIQSLLEFHHSSLQICASCFCYQFHKLIQVIINRPGFFGNTL